MSAESEHPHSETSEIFPQGEKYKLGAGGRVYQIEDGPIKRYLAIKTDNEEKVVEKEVELLVEDSEQLPDVYVFHKGESEGITDILRVDVEKRILEVLHCNGTEQPIQSLYYFDTVQQELPFNSDPNNQNPNIEVLPAALFDQAVFTFRGMQKGIENNELGVGRFHNFAELSDPTKRHF